MDVTEVFGKAYHGTACWRTRIPEEATDFIEAVEKHMANTGQRPVWTLLADKLATFGFVITGKTIGSHYGGRCSCPK